MNQAAEKMTPEQSRRINRVKGMIDPVPIQLSPNNEIGKELNGIITHDSPMFKIDIATKKHHMS